jgi:hypothetical protein
MTLRGVVPHFNIHVSVSDFLYSYDRSENTGQQNKRTDPGNIEIAH